MTVQTYTRNTRPPEYALPYIQNTLNGNYLPGAPGGNPYLDRTFDMAALRTQNQLSSEFARSGRNVEASEALRAQQLGDLGTQIYGGAYDAERNRQNGVLGYAGSDQVSTSPLHRDRIGELLGGLMMGGELLGTAGDLYDQYFGDDAINPGTGNGESAGNVGDVGGVLGGAGAAGSAAGGTVASGGGVAAGGGTMGSGVLGSSGTGVATGGGGAAGAAGAAGGLGALAGGAHAGALGGLGATAAAGEAALLGGAMPTLAPLGGAAAGGAAGGGAAAASGAGAGAGLGALGIAGLAALPIALGIAGVYGDPEHDETSQRLRAHQGLGTRAFNTHWGQQLMELPNGEYIDYNSVKHQLDDRYGKEPNESVMAWLMSQPRVAYTTPHLVRPRGPNVPAQDYR